MNDLVSEQKKDISKTTNIESLESEFLTLPQEQCPVVHRFGPGIYMREVSLPAGSLVIGHHQNFEHTNIFLKGRITFFGDNGPVEMKAPINFIGKPGRKIAYVHEDSVWINVYSTTETDVEKLEAKYLTKSDTWINDQIERDKVRLITSTVDKNDFILALKEFGLTEEMVKSVSENQNDLMALPFGGYKIKTKKSNIEGIGLFATGDFEPNEVIAPARINGKRTIAGRFTNHSAFPNAKMVKGDNCEIALIATKKIMGCHGGQDGEEITINYRESISLTLEIGENKCQV